MERLEELSWLSDAACWAVVRRAVTTSRPRIMGTFSSPPVLYRWHWTDHKGYNEQRRDDHMGCFQRSRWKLIHPSCRGRPSGVTSKRASRFCHTLFVFVLESRVPKKEYRRVRQTWQRSLRLSPTLSLRMWRSVRCSRVDVCSMGNRTVLRLGTAQG